MDVGFGGTLIGTVKAGAESAGLRLRRVGGGGRGSAAAVSTEGCPTAEAPVRESRFRREG